MNAYIVFMMNVGEVAAVTFIALGLIIVCFVIPYIFYRLYKQI
jgi:hypothetical protein